VTQGGLVQVPSTTRAWVPVAGLWAGTLPASYIFGGWLHDGEPWDFATDTVTADKTLAATWTTPSPIELDLYGTNLVSAAMAHVNANPEAFTLAIGADVDSGPNALTAEDADLTVVGLGSGAVISLTETGRLFSVGHASDQTSNARLTLRNITLEGREQAYDLVRVWNGGRLYMDTGTTITGHTNTSPGTLGGLGAAVNVGADGTFTMRGGTITGNRAAHANGHTYLSGGVFVNNDATSRFYMKGGSITGNTREMGPLPGAADVFILNNVIYFALSGDARIHTLTLNSYSTTNASITIGSGGWSGSVSNLYLRAGNTLTATFAGWLNRTVLQAASNQIITADVERIASKRFMVGSTATPPPLVSDTHEIVIEDGVGVLRANP
jgi:hypothetical protein